MATQSKIEWTDCTWNPVIGCRHVAEGCRHCYAETMSKRLAAMGQRDYASILTKDGKFNGKAITRPATLAEPLHWKKPRMVFVNSMSDLFHEDVSFEFIAAVFGVMAACPQHTFQVLTKRPARALEFFEWLRAMETDKFCARTKCDMEARRAGAFENAGGDTLVRMAVRWPAENVWLGYSIAEQKDVWLLDTLMRCPAAVRFASVEPLIGPVDFDAERGPCVRSGKMWKRNQLTGIGGNTDGSAPHKTGKLDWVIVGGESGPGARPCDVAWIRSIVGQCKAAAVPVFVKQLGANSQEQFGGSGALRPRLKTANRKGGDPSEWPEDLRVREFPQREGARA